MKLFNKITYKKQEFKFMRQAADKKSASSTKWLTRRRLQGKNVNPRDDNSF